MASVDPSTPGSLWSVGPYIAQAPSFNVAVAWKGCALSLVLQNKPLPLLTWHVRPTSCWCFSWTPSLTPSPRSIPFICFPKILCTRLVYAHQTLWWLVVYLPASQLDCGLLEGENCVWLMLLFFVHDLIHKQREVFVEWVNVGSHSSSLFMLVTLLSGLHTG